MTAGALSVAMVTASYAPDFERCRLLCETMDRNVTGVAQHYLLVEAGDLPLFRSLEGAYRTVLDERELLPSWLRAFPDPLSLFRRRIWLSRHTRPLRGWHVQQLRRIAIAAHVPEDVLVYCDSDVAFIRPLDGSAFVHDGQVRLFRRDDALEGPNHEAQREWSVQAGRALGLAPVASRHDYIATLIAWRRSAVTAMCARIEDVAGRHWVAAVASSRRFSECMLYGRFVDDVLAGEGHFLADEELCRVYWTGPRLSDEGLRGFLAGMTPSQVAIGMQSFIGTDLALLRRLIAG